MTNKSVKLATGFISALTLATAMSFADEINRSGQITDTNKAIKQTGAKWVAGETEISNLSEDRWQRLVGFDYKPIKAPVITELEYPDKAVTSQNPASVDWRNNGGNFVSTPKQQGQCGSCWAFAMTGGLESFAMRSQNKPGSNLDLSEQVLLSCSGVGSCERGGTLDADYLENPGLPPEKYYPYTATNGNCSSAGAGWQKESYTVGSWGSVPRSLDAMKTALVKYGPIPTAMMVYEDFMHYKSGVYTHVSGKQLGGHAILLVGYDDVNQCFIVKNSWGTNWGESGFFRIAYSELKTIFGLSTIAYKTKTARGEYSMSDLRDKTAVSTYDSDSTLERIHSIVPTRMPNFD